MIFWLFQPLLTIILMVIIITRLVTTNLLEINESESATVADRAVLS